MPVMHQRTPPLLDMTPDGRFRPPPAGRAGVPVSTRILVGAILVAALAGAASMAALALWIASMLIPVAAAAVIVAYATLRYRAWRAGGPLVRGRGGMPRRYY